MCVFVCVVFKDGHYCTLLEVTDRSRSTTSVTKLLQELEMKRVVSLAYFNVYCMLINYRISLIKMKNNNEK